MKRKFFNLAINISFGIVIIIIVLVVATISITKKINDFNLQNQANITAVVQKNDVPVLSFTKGIIKTINVQEGDQVKKGQLLAEISNPLLEERVRVLLSVPNNVSAQTEGQVAALQLQYDKVYAPVDGTIGQIDTTIDSPVDEYSKLMDIYQSTDTKILAYLTVDQYTTAVKMSKIPAFSQRLNQDFYLSPSILKPNQEPSSNSLLAPAQQGTTTSQIPSNTIALFFKLNNPGDANSLLNGEQLELDFQPQQYKVSKPIDYFVAFWNKLIK